jgi:hypothetical protein
MVAARAAGSSSPSRYTAARNAVNSISRIIDDVLAELPEDWVGLWWIPARLREDFAIKDSDEVRERSLEIVRALLSHRGVHFGHFSSGRFERWSLTPDEVVTRIGREWRDLRHAPDIGEIGWFERECYACPVCGFDLDFEPWSNGSPSDEMCPCCGIQFGYDDAAGGEMSDRAEVYDTWRQRWIAAGSHWASSDSPPRGWSATSQLRRLGVRVL